MKKITVEYFNENIFEINESFVFKGNKPCIIDFYADWCKPCKTTFNILSQLERENPDIDFYKVDAEDEYDLIELFGIKSLPTMVMIDDGDVKIQRGFLEKSKIDQLLNEFIKNSSLMIKS